MNASTVLKSYGCLSPEERFRLILAASGRGDEAERDRLIRAGGRMNISLGDHAPFAVAFSELSHLTFIELSADATAYFDFLLRSSGAFDEMHVEELEEADDFEGKPLEETADDLGETQRSFDLPLAVGYMLRTKAEGWKLFCQRLNLPPFLLWEGYPGFSRLQRTLALTEKAAYVPEGFLRWHNRKRPKDTPELTEVPLTAEGVADANEEAFRQRVRWWGG